MGIFRAPKMPAPPPPPAPAPEPPSYDDELRRIEIEEKRAKVRRNRKGRKQTILTGRFEVLAALSYSGTPVAYDGRSQIKKDLDLVEAAIRALLNNGVIQEYKIGNRTAKKYDLSELLVLKAALKAAVLDPVPSCVINIEPA